MVIKKKKKIYSTQNILHDAPSWPVNQDIGNAKIKIKIKIKEKKKIDNFPRARAFANPPLYS